jgi:hypothetical protein
MKWIRRGASLAILLRISLQIAPVRQASLPLRSAPDIADGWAAPADPALVGRERPPSLEADPPGIPELLTDSDQRDSQPAWLDLPAASALKVVQQPADDPVYVSYELGTVTQFSLPAKYGTTALLAHNVASGALFSSLRLSDVATVRYPDGKSRIYRIQQIRRFRTVHPNDPRSDFVDLDQGGPALSVVEVFRQLFTEPGRLVLQTCIAAGGNSSWGIQFAVAMPVNWPMVVSTRTNDVLERPAGPGHLP